jgi:hypothetical protein
MGCPSTTAASGRSLVAVGEGLAIVAVAGGGATVCTAVLVGLGVVSSLGGAPSVPQLTNKPTMMTMTNPNRLWLNYPPRYEIMDDLFEIRSYYTRRPHFVQTEPRELLFAKRLLL